MNDQQSTPLSAGAERARAEKWKSIAMRYYVEGDARERPSALDVERLGEVVARALKHGGWQVDLLTDYIVREYARLTEPDAGEGTERGCTCDGYGGHARGCALNLDTTEATLRAALERSGSVSDCETALRLLQGAVSAALQHATVQPEGGPG